MTTMRGAGGRPATDLAVAAARLRDDIDRAYLDPALPTSKAAVIKRTGLAGSTLHDHRNDPLIKAQLDRLGELQKARRSARATVAAGTAGAMLNPVDVAAPRGTSAHAEAAGRTPATKAPLHGRSDFAALDDVQICARYEEARQKTLWAASKLVARYRKVGHVADLPAAAYHLDKGLGELHAALSLMRPLAEEWVRRAGGPTDSAPVQEALDLT